MTLAQLRLSLAHGKRQVVSVVFDVILDSPGRIPADLKRERPNLFLMANTASTSTGNHDLRLFATQNRMNNSSSMLLGEERWVAALPANHPKARQREIKLSRMKSESFIQFRGDRYAETMDEMCSEAGFKPSIAYSLGAESRGGIGRLISEGLGCCIVPERVWRSEWSPSQIALVPFSDITRTRYIYSSLPENRELTEEELFIIQYIKRKLNTEAAD
jgi:DNA-binding transcriptional LysR family regulator